MTGLPEWPALKVKVGMYYSKNHQRKPHGPDHASHPQTDSTSFTQALLDLNRLVLPGSATLLFPRVRIV